jgi:tRNA(Ile)-lysidine synthase
MLAPLFRAALTRILRKLETPPATLIAALSGGMDSVVAAHLLARNLDLFPEGTRILAAHVNHGLRAEAEGDLAFCREYAEGLGLAFAEHSLDVAALAAREHLGLEEAGRLARYRFFHELGGAGGLVLTGHHADDQAETVLFRLIRGTGTDGLAGIAYKRKEKGFDVIRPLLDVNRDEIEAYCEQYELNPRIDATNLEPIYARNKIRLELLPYLSTNFNPNMQQALIRLSKIAAEDKAYLWEVTDKAYTWAKTGSNTLNLKRLRSLPAAIRHRVIMKAFKEIGLEQDITTVHLAAADKLLRGGVTSKTVEFVKDYCLCIEYETVYFCKKETALSSPLPAPRSSAIELSARLLEQGETMPPGGAAFDLDKMRPLFGRVKLSLRTRQPGDYIQLNVGRKKLQDFMVDQKIPSRERDNIPLVAMGCEVLWVIATSQNSLTKHRYTSAYKLGAETKRVLALELICET